MARIFWLTLGFFSLGMSILGIFLPLLPTTPLVLLAATCFARSSDKMHRWILDNKLLGPTIRLWEESGTITLRAKILSIVFLNLTLLSSAIFISDTTVSIILFVIGFAVTLYIYRIPTA